MGHSEGAGDKCVFEVWQSGCCRVVRGAQLAAVLAELRYCKDHFTVTSSLTSHAIGLISFFRPLARDFWLTH